MRTLIILASLMFFRIALGQSGVDRAKVENLKKDYKNKTTQELLEIYCQSSKNADLPGRFHLTQLGEFRRDQFLLDTKTGRIWQSVCAKIENKECIGLHWQEMLVEGINSNPDK